ncbi:methyl-coenzyme M reductase II subunit gamma, putative [Actinidia rufa]|uniref:Methyl-coenzyme M reductase II subunit gamma, putative n=1 Tax=Actinidia rufa TaxID=165716 RepID=A0A7J0GRK9_9ERIC|nr:methyl-coenzyme M reductase II subunit gamma, putative [Actinidia rufa]
MNGTQNSKTGNLEKPFPGCLGRMVNLFDLSTSVAGNRLLTDKPHRDGSPLSMGRSDAAGMSPIVDPIEDKVTVSELGRSYSNKSANGTPMKMLIAQEMSKELESKHKPPSVVAKLMGLDALPQQQPDSAVQRKHSRDYSLGRLEIPLDYWQQGDELGMQMQRQIHHYQAQNENKDAYEIWHQSQKGYARESKQNGRHNENINDRKMALIRQKFTEAKSLATNEKLRQSKQFHDALDVLCSNKDLFLKFLQEPNSLLSQHTLDLQSVPPLPETKRITVLRPSKMVNNNKFSGPGKKGEKHIKKASHTGQGIRWEKGNPGFPPPNWQVNDNPTQPTRIVVLKPSPGKPHDIKAVVSPPSSSPRVLHEQEFYGEREDDESRELSEVAKEITWQMRENLSGHRRDETLLSSVLSNGYVGDDSSFNVSENEFAVGNNSDTEVIEVVSPTSRHSWDYINRFGSPYSSSFSRASYSPESSVCREAKKRLSERWAMMASNGNFQEQRHVWRSSSTLGEMLALSDTKNSAISEEDRNKEQKPRESKLCAASNKDENIDNSPRNLLRSKSLPVSSSVFGGRPNVEVSAPKVGKADVPKRETKQQIVKSSLKGKVSSLFFSRNKNIVKKNVMHLNPLMNFKTLLECLYTALKRLVRVCPNVILIVEMKGILCLLYKDHQAKYRLLVMEGRMQNLGLFNGLYMLALCPRRLSVLKPAVSGNVSENQDHPSPISVLEPLYEDVDNIKAGSSNNSDKHGAKLPAHSLKSNLIDKSPPIESIARTLSWDESCIDTATSYHLKPSSVSQGTEEEERELLFFVESLLSVAGLDGEDSRGPCIIHGSGPGVCAWMKERFSCEVKCFLGDGGDGNGLVVERVVRREVVGKSWAEQRNLVIDNIGEEIERKLLEELVHEAVVELTGTI